MAKKKLNRVTTRTTMTKRTLHLIDSDAPEPKFLFISTSGKWAAVVGIGSILEGGHPLVPMDLDADDADDEATYVGLVPVDTPEGEVDLDKWELPPAAHRSICEDEDDDLNDPSLIDDDEGHTLEERRQAIIDENRQQHLYFDGGEYTGGRAVFIPQGWCDGFKDGHAEEDGPSIYCWIGNTRALDFLKRQGKEWVTTDAQGWVPIDELVQMRQITEQEARQLDPDLFRLLDAIGSGEAK